MANVEIRIRQESDPIGPVLGEVPFQPESFDSLLSTIKAWGLSFNGNGEAGDNAYGQFVVYGDRAFFEIVIPD